MHTGHPRGEPSRIEPIVGAAARVWIGRTWIGSERVTSIRGLTEHEKCPKSKFPKDCERE